MIALYNRDVTITSQKKHTALFTENIKLYQAFFTQQSEEKRKLFQKTTPIFIFNGEVFNQRLNALTQTLGGFWEESQIAYSLKTNYTIIKTKTFQRSACMTEVVSKHEYMLARKQKISGARIVCNGPNKTTEDILLMAKNHSIINIDNTYDLTKCLLAAKKQSKPIKIGLRLRPTGFRIPKSRFGFPLDSGEATQAVSFIKNHQALLLRGIHVHLGTDIDSPSHYRVASQKIARFILHEGLSDSLDYVDFGGGFPAHGRKPFQRRTWSPRPIEQYIEAIATPLKQEVNWQQVPLLIVEPGRYLVDDSVSLLSSIVAIEQNSQEQILTCDTTTTTLPLVHYRPQRPILFHKFRLQKSRLIKTTIFGASCREDDLLFYGYLPSARVGDQVLFLVVGAYNQAMSSDFITPAPACIETESINYK